MKPCERVNTAIIQFLDENGPSSARDISNGVSKRYRNITSASIGYMIRLLRANGTVSIVGDSHSNGHIYDLTERFEKEEDKG